MQTGTCKKYIYNYHANILKRKQTHKQAYTLIRKHTRIYNHTHITHSNTNTQAHTPNTKTHSYTHSNKNTHAHTHTNHTLTNTQPYMHPPPPHDVGKPVNPRIEP